MSLDLSNTAHVRALRYVCRRIIQLKMDADEIATWACDLEGMTQAPNPPIGAHATAKALAVLTDPIPAADLLRRLLERCGVTVVEHGTSPGEPRWPCVLIYDLAAEPCCVVVSPRRMPHIAIDLLDAHDHAAALAALRGER